MRIMQIMTNAPTLIIYAIMSWGCASAPRSDGHGMNSPGSDSSPMRYQCFQAVGPLVIDGQMNESEWASASWTDAFVDIEGDLKPQPRFETQVKMLWDNQNLYVAAWLEEPHVWATLTTHDQIVYHDNDFEIFIDPDGDRAEYYEVEINALGTIFDLFLERTYIDGGPAFHEWELIGMRSAIHIEGTLNDPTDIDQGWSVEFALPWCTLAEYAHCVTPPKDGDVWRINFSRVQWKHHIIHGEYEKVPNVPENNWVWSPQGTINMHLPEYWGYLEFITGIEGEK